MADQDVLVATIPKNGREEIRVSLTEFKGYDLVNMRVWFRTDEGDMRPGKAGLAFRVEKLSDLIQALQQAQRAAEARE